MVENGGNIHLCEITAFLTRPGHTMSTPLTYVPRHLLYNGPSPYEKGKWVPGWTAPLPPRVRRNPGQFQRHTTIPEDEVPAFLKPVEPRIQSKSPASTSTSEGPLEVKPKDNVEEREGNIQLRKKASKTTIRQSDAPIKPSKSFSFSSIPRLFFCCISTRPTYTQIQGLIIPTSQICVDTKALRFLQSLPRQEFLLLTYLVQEVFTDDGVKVLGRIPEYDGLIEKALRGQIRTVKRPWTSSEREGFVEHTAGLYARLLRKLETYEKAPMCKKVYGRKFGGK
ncbi:hypothetical protein TWF281_008799 [Arthrobotrys megalospora]